MFSILATIKNCVYPTYHEKVLKNNVGKIYIETILKNKSKKNILEKSF